jgi:uncharacterized protein (TIGR02266 family)
MGPSLPDGAERRAAPRFEVQAVVDVTAPASTTERHRVVNVSVGGVCLRTAQIEDIGTEIEMAIHFPDLGASIEVRGRVAWCNRQDPTDMGVRFIGLDDERRATLRRYIDLVLALPRAG